jgi:hypothetical protein
MGLILAALTLGVVGMAPAQASAPPGRSEPVSFRLEAPQYTGGGTVMAHATIPAVAGLAAIALTSIAPASASRLFRKKPVTVEAITFEELVEYGRENGANIVNGMPWSFQYKGHPITHENDDCYLIPTLEGTMEFRRGDMLITGVKGEIYPCKAEIFAATYEPAAAPTG